MSVMKRLKLIFSAKANKALDRAEPVRHAGPEIQIPYAGDAASGLAKPLRSISSHPEPMIPITTSAIATLKPTSRN